MLECVFLAELLTFTKLFNFSGFCHVHMKIQILTILFDQKNFHKSKHNGIDAV